MDSRVHEVKMAKHERKASKRVVCSEQARGFVPDMLGINE